MFTSGVQSRLVALRSKRKSTLWLTSLDVVNVPAQPCLCSLHLHRSRWSSEPSLTIYSQREATCCTPLYTLENRRKSKCWYSNAFGKALEARSALALHETLNLATSLKFLFGSGLGQTLRTHSRRIALRAIHFEYFAITFN